MKDMAERDDKIIHKLSQRLEEIASKQPPENFEM